MLYSLKANIIIAGISFFLSSCSNAPETEHQTNIVPIKVNVATPGINTQNDIHASGQIKATEIANISTRVMGYITKINVKVGDPVKKGQLLATISNDDIMAKKAQTEAMLTLAQAALVNAEKDFHRYTELHRQHSASDKELENITLQYHSAKAQVEAARQMRNEVIAMLEYTNLTAPFNGVVTQKLADAGSIANPGMPLLVLEQSSGFYVSATVTESDIDKIIEGSAVMVLVKSTGKKLNGKLTEISQSSQFTGGQYQIKVAISDPTQSGIYAGMYVTIFIPVKEMLTAEHQTGSPLIPVTSLVNRDQLTGIYTISSDHTALLRWVRLGKTVGDEVEVLSGLSINEKFIISSEGKLFNGAKVTEVNN
jgi:RND family efflux transporter MFP subunit